MGVRASTATLSTEQVLRILDSLYEVEQTRDAWVDGVLDECEIGRQERVG
jgi:hypothetical protein